MNRIWKQQTTTRRVPPDHHSELRMPRYTADQLKGQTVLVDGRPVTGTTEADTDEGWVQSGQNPRRSGKVEVKPAPTTAAPSHAETDAAPTGDHA